MGMGRTRRSKPIRKATQNNAEPDEENETPKALLNDVVLQNIFKYLGYEDLKASRKVGNITWLKNCKKTWWTRTKVVFSLGYGGLDKTTEYLKHVDITSNVTNYRLEYITVEPIEDLEDSDDSEDSEDFKDSNYFWNTLGHSIIHLELFYVSFPSLVVFPNIIYNKCPNLEKLVIENFSIVEYDGFDEPLEFEKPLFGENRNLRFLKLKLVDSRCPRHMPLSWMELLSHFPCMKGLDVRAHYKEVYKTIAIIRQHDPKMLKLNHIDILSQVNDDYEQSIRSVLLDPNLSFETIRMKAKNCRLETISEILGLHAKSLKNFGIYHHFPETKPLSIPQPLKKLGKLAIECCAFTPEIFKCIPNVKKVELDLTNLSHDLSKEVESNLKIKSCKEFTLITSGLWRDESNWELAFYLKVFPNVEILEIGDINNLRFSMICERWTKIMSIKVDRSEVDVVGLLGFDPYSKAKTKIRNSNITNLKDLKSFSMTTRKRLEMKYGSVILKQLEGLQHLRKFELNGYELKGDLKIWKKISDKFRPVEDEDSD